MGINTCCEDFDAILMRSDVEIMTELEVVDVLQSEGDLKRFESRSPLSAITYAHDSANSCFDSLNIICNINCSSVALIKEISPTRVLRRAHSTLELLPMANNLVSISKNGKGVRAVSTKAEAVSSVSDGASNGGGAANGRMHKHRRLRICRAEIFMGYCEWGQCWHAIFECDWECGAGVNEFDVVDAGGTIRGDNPRTRRPYYSYQNPSASSPFSPYIYQPSLSHPYASERQSTAHPRRQRQLLARACLVSTCWCRCRFRTRSFMRAECASKRLRVREAAGCGMRFVFSPLFVF